MHHWDRDSSGRLQRVCTPTDQTCEVSVHSENIDPLPEEQQSQQAAPMNPTAYRSMRDHIHPPRVSAPSCIIPPADDVVVRPYLVPCFPHSMEWRMRILILISGNSMKYAQLLRKECPTWICSS